MKNSIITMIMMSIIFIQSCAAQKTTTEIDSVTVKSYNEGVTNPIEEVYSSYIGLKNALVKDNGDSASYYAKLLYKATGTVTAARLTSSQSSTWMKFQEKISYDAEHIKSTTELEHQREHFMSLSKNMYELIKAFSSNTSDVYYQFCPMANNGKGAYWMSENSRIMNPYYGKKMLNCGSTKETIKSK